ncbi:MAG TPA: hypothetical protein VJH90_00830 [archaeon]|nr:hypothetical protein [archaeon]
MKRMTLATLFILSIFSVASYAEEQFFHYSVESEIFENKTVFYKYDLIFTDIVTPIILDFNSAEHLSYESFTECREKKNTFGIQLACQPKEGSFKVSVTHSCDTCVVERDGQFQYRYSIKVPLYVKKLYALVKIPEGMGLLNQENPFFPADANVASDGRRPILKWSRDSLPADSSFDVSVAYESLGIYSQFRMEYVIALFAIIAIAFLGYGLYTKKAQVKLILPLMKKDEKIVLESILKHGQGVNQKSVVKETNYSKAKVSKVLNSLQERGIVKLERSGRTNKIFLEGNFKKQQKGTFSA